MLLESVMEWESNWGEVRNERKSPETQAEGGVGCYRMRDVCTIYLTYLRVLPVADVRGKMVNKST